MFIHSPSMVNYEPEKDAETIFSPQNVKYNKTYETHLFYASH